MGKTNAKNPKSVGMEVREKFFGEDGPKALEKLQKHSPRIARWVMENLFGEVYANKTLDLRTRSLCTLSALIVLGNEAVLKNHFRAALRIGITQEELRELITQLLWYAGLPAASRAIAVLDGLSGDQGNL